MSRAYSLLLQEMGLVEIRRVERDILSHAVRFIESWSSDDAYQRFGSSGIGGQTWLAQQLRQHGRSAFVAVHERGVVGLLDHINANGATHIGIVVERQLRRRTIGTMLLRALLQSALAARPLLADCSRDNYAAAALLRSSRFKPIDRDRYQITWRHE